MLEKGIKANHGSKAGLLAYKRGVAKLTCNEFHDRVAFSENRGQKSTDEKQHTNRFCILVIFVHCLLGRLIYRLRRSRTNKLEQNVIQL